MQNVLAIGSGKGGVGKSTISAALALLFRQIGWHVALLDADIYGPSLKAMLPAQTLPREENGFLIPAQSFGIEIISLAYFPKFQKGASVRAPFVNGILQQFLTKVKWTFSDLLIIDLPPGTGDIHLTIFQTIHVSQAIAITLPHKISTLDVEKSIYLFQKMQIPLLGIIENMSFYQEPLSGEKCYLFGQGGGRFLSEKFSTPLLGQIPIDQKFMQAFGEGKPPVSSQAKEILWKIVVEICETLCHNRGEFDDITIKKIDSYHIELSTKKKRKLYRFSEIQKRCPCAKCFDAETKERHPCQIDPHVSITTMQKIGRYAVRFAFTSGCSEGIYTWQNLFF